MDVKRAADLYAQGWTLRQIGAELGAHWAAVGDQLHRANVTMRSGGHPAHPVSTQQILQLRDQGLTWNEVAEQVDMTVSGAWSRYRRARLAKPPRLGRWQQVLADGLDKNLQLAYVQPSLIILVEPPAELSSPPHDELRTVSRRRALPACFTCQAPMPTTMRAIAAIWYW